MTLHSSKVSIVTPLYNRGKLACETIASVQAQTYPNWELLIVDDHSTDDSLQVVRSFSERDKRIRCWTRQSSVRGAPSCRNEGLAAATGEVILFLDSDDLLIPSCLVDRLTGWDAIETSSQQKYDFSVFPLGFFSHRVGDSELTLSGKSEHPLADFIFPTGAWLICSPLWRRQAIDRLGGFRLDLLSFQDMELHVRALLHGLTYCHLDQPPTCYVRRGHGERITAYLHSPDHLQKRTCLIQDLEQQVMKLNRMDTIVRERFIRQYALIGKYYYVLKRNGEAEAIFREFVAPHVSPSEWKAMLSNAYRSAIKFRLRTWLGKYVPGIRLGAKILRRIRRSLFQRQVKSSS